jgi:uncharacterized protein YciI
VNHWEDRPAPLTVVLYHSAGDVMERAPQHMPKHSALIDEFHEAGELLLIGTFGDPVREGAMCVFASRDAADRFVRRDPFVTEGLVASYDVREWNEILRPVPSG